MFTVQSKQTLMVCSPNQRKIREAADAGALDCFLGHPHLPRPHVEVMTKEVHKDCTHLYLVS